MVSINNPVPDLLLLDKQLAYAKLNKINPIICINKIDLDKNDKLYKIVSLYRKIGYTVTTTNAKEKDGIKELRKLLKNNITAFSGNSGVGKSTLINALFENNLTQEGEVSNKIKRGKNTTTNVTLYKLEENSYIADTPGFSTFDLSEIKSDELDGYFIEFKEYIKECQYIGCNHIKENEAECGVKKALKEEKISPERYERYKKIYEIIKDKEDRKWQ